MSLQHAYESKLNKGFNTNAILLEIAKAKLGNELHSTQDGIFYITENHDVSPFFYPIYDKETDSVYVDSRPFTALAKDGSLNIRNKIDEELINLCALLEREWINKDKTDTFYSAFSFSNEIFIRWFTDIIGHRFGLDPFQKTRIMAVTAMYSLGQYYNNIDSQFSAEKHLQQVKRNLPIDYQTLKDTAELLDYHFPRDIDEFVKAVNDLDMGPRFHGFNSTVIYGLLNGAWWSNANTPQLVGLSIEYPPVFAALCYMATKHNMFKKSGIGEAVSYKQRDHKNYQRAIDLLVK